MSLTASRKQSSTHITPNDAPGETIISPNENAANISFVHTQNVLAFQ